MSTNYAEIVAKYGGRITPADSTSANSDDIVAKFGGRVTKKAKRTSLESAKDFASEVHTLNPGENLAALKATASAIPDLLGTAGGNIPAARRTGVRMADAAKGFWELHKQVGKEAIASAKGGDVAGALRKLQYFLTPFVGPRLNDAMNLMEEKKYAKAFGAMTDAGLIAFGPELAGKGMKKISPRVVKVATNRSKTLIEQAFKVQGRREKVALKRAMPGIQAVDVVGTPEDILRDATAIRKAKGAAIGGTINSPGVRNRGVSLAPVRKAIAQEKANAVNVIRKQKVVTTQVPAGKLINPSTNQPFTPATTKSRTVSYNDKIPHNTAAETRLAQLSKIEELFDRYSGPQGDMMTARHAHTLKRAWGRYIKRYGAFDEKSAGTPFNATIAEETMADVQRAILPSIAKELDQVVPEIRKLNEQFGFAADIETAIKPAIFRVEAEQSNPLLRVMSSPRTAGVIAGAGVAAYTHNPFYAVLVGGVTGEGAQILSNLFRSTRWKLQSSARKMALARAFASRNPEQVAKAVAALQAADTTLNRPRDFDKMAGGERVPRP